MSEVTKEELIKEAQEQVNYCTPLYPECFIQGYVASAGLREKRIEELEKENVELKADNEARKFAMAMSEKVENKLREENIKGTNIIKSLLDNISEPEVFSDGSSEDKNLSELLKQAEQFIKDSEVEK